MMRRFIIAVAAVAALAASSAYAEDDKKAPGLGGELDSAVQDALRAIERFVDSFPGYEAPEVTPEGDIIIRRKRPTPAPHDAAPVAKDQRQI